jgi:hypothetical protein
MPAAAHRPKVQAFRNPGRILCRVPSCEKPFSRSDTLKRHICTTDDPTHKSLATVMDQTHCIECHDTRAAPRNLTRHDRGSHNTSVLRLDRILGGELWSCRDTCKCLVAACLFVLQHSQILMLLILQANSPTPVSDSLEHNPDNYTFQSSVQDMVLPKVMSNNGVSDGNSLRLETSPNTHLPLFGRRYTTLEYGNRSILIVGPRSIGSR